MAKFLIFYPPLREGIVERGNPKGGSLTQTIMWMKGLNELNHQIYLIKDANDNRNELSEFSWVSSIKVYNKNKFKKFLVWFSYRFPKIFIAFNKYKFDYVYHAMPVWYLYFIKLIGKVTKTKQIIRIANDKNVDRSLANDNGFVKNFFTDLSIKSADFVIAQNEFQLKVLQDKYKVPNAIKISNPIEIDYDYLNSKLNYSGKISWVANFRHQKNLKLLFDIACLLPHEEFQIAGQALHPMDSETSMYYEKLKTLNNVKFLGVLTRNNILNILKKSKFLLCTSRYEGFSNTFLESFITGTPVLTNVNVNPDGIISNFDLGYIYKDSTDLVEILQNIHLSEYKNKSKNCIRYVQEYHDHITLSKKLIDFLECSQ